jgi:hypothetical protein
MSLKNNNMIPDKIPHIKADIFFEEFKHKIKLHDRYKTPADKLAVQQSLQRSAYDLAVKHSTTLFASHSVLNKFSKDFRKDNKLTTDDHCLRPSSHFFQMILLPKYRKKYLNKNLLTKILNIMTTCCKVLKEENQKLKSFNPRSQLLCTTKELYKKAEIKVYSYTKDKVENNYYTPAFDLLPIEVQDDITEYENYLISLNV